MFIEYEGLKACLSKIKDEEAQNFLDFTQNIVEPNFNHSINTQTKENKTIEAIVINDIEVEFELAHNKIFTNSLQVAEVFGKKHYNVIRDIRALPQDDFTALNFEFSEYKDSTGRTLPCYNLTRDAFSLLVMGFTGVKAYEWKVEFIKAFNLMEQKLKDNESKQTLIPQNPNTNTVLNLALANITEMQKLIAINQNLNLELNRYKYLFRKQGEFTLNEVAKMFHIAEFELKAFLIKEHIIISHPFQTRLVPTNYAMEQGYAKLKLSDTRQVYPQLYLTMAMVDKIKEFFVS